MARAASLAVRGVTLTLSSGTILAFCAFNPDLYLASLMTSDTTGKALQHRVVRNKTKQSKPSHTYNL